MSQENPSSQLVVEFIYLPVVIIPCSKTGYLLSGYFLLKIIQNIRLRFKGISNSGA